MNNKLIIKAALFLILMFSVSGCGEIKDFNKNLKDINLTINNTRDKVLSFLKDSSATTLHDISVGLLSGTIGYLDRPQNRDSLALFFDSIIVHTVGPTRMQLISFRDSLVSPYFVKQVRSLLQGIMNELLINPSENLLTFILSPHMQGQVNSLLRMIIPALINDSAITQIDKLRSSLLGYKMRSDVALLVDTSLGVLNYRLKNSLRPSIDSIAKESAEIISKDAKDDTKTITWYLIGLAFAIALFALGFQLFKSYQKKKLLYYLTAEIEKFRNVDEDKFHVLTGNIHQTMLDQRLEGTLSKMLVNEGINKN
jgi:hypothetical protein